MKATRYLLDRLATLLAGDVATLAPTSAGVKVRLVKAAFSPSDGTLFSDLTVATFVGGEAKPAAVGVQQSFRDTLTGSRVVQLLEPSGGWHWQATSATGLPETIFGFVVTSADDAFTFGSGLLPVPVVVEAIGDAVDIPQLRFAFSAVPLS
jgi:hypothetical protein